MPDTKPDGGLEPTPPTALDGAPPPPPAPEKEPRADAMSFLDHLGELRRRLFWSAIALFGAFLVCWPFARTLFAFMSEPVHRFLPPGETLAYTRLTSPFFVYMKVAALAAIFVAAPFLLLQVWLFVAPGLYRNEKRYVIPFILTSTGCFLVGAWFAFRVLFPSVCGFFLSVGEGLTMVVTVDEYFDLLFWTVLGVAVTFELPVIIGLLARLGIVTSGFLLHHLHFAVVGCLIASALITPTPDAITMLIVATPMLGLYILGILVAKVLEPRQTVEKTDE